MIHTEVTAVKLHGNYILAGIGSNLCAYRVYSPDYCASTIKVLKEQKIYGILPSKCGKKLLIYGGRQYAILSIGECDQNDTNIFTTIIEPQADNDCLMSAVWLNEEEVAFLTSQNILKKCNVMTQKTVETHPSKENSAIHSSFLLTLEDSLLILTGTSNYQVNIHSIGDNEPLHQLQGHQGDVLSISYHIEKDFIVTTSADHSIRLWSLKAPNNNPTNTLDYWRNVIIECKYVLREHNSRVVGSVVTPVNILSIGEDSCICHWSFEGKLLRKASIHHNGNILCIDANLTHALTGGEDGAIIYHSLVTSNDFCEKEILNLDIGPIKKVKFTYKKNLLLVSETDLILYDVPNKKITRYKLDHQSSYKMLDLSEYAQRIAIADMSGKLDIFLETGKQDAFLVNIMDTKLCIGKILSMHWTRNYLVFCCVNGIINILYRKHKNMEFHSKYKLPQCKKRWLTAASKFCNNELFVCGDASGNIHMYTKGNENPLKSFSKVHGNDGPTIIYLHPREIITAGNDGKINYFACNYKVPEFKYTSQRLVEFKQLEKFLDSYQEVICGFKKKRFIVYNLRNDETYIEIPCGGRHKTWDAVKYWEKSGEAIQFVYLKNNNIVRVTVHLAYIHTLHSIESSHTKVINCMKTHVSNGHKTTFYITGGEDATLRVSDTCSVYDFRRRVLLQHPASITTLKVFDLGIDDFLLVSGGGTRQICIRRIDINKYTDFAAVTVRDLIDYNITDTKNTKDHEDIGLNTEIKIMEVDIIKADDAFLLFAGCSDGILRVFTLIYEVKVIKPEEWLIDHGQGEFKLLYEIRYHNTNILKTRCIRVINRDVLVTCSTLGDIAFWNISDIKLKLGDCTPFFKATLHNSSIRSFTYCSISDKKFLVATGGDDNMIYLNLFEINDQSSLTSIQVLDQWSSANYHSSPITGLYFVNKYMLSLSEDQWINLFAWEVSEERIRCIFLSKHWTDVADVRGFDFMEISSDFIKICVFGKGIEVLNIPL